MPALRDTQATFGGGELTPALWGRTDLQKYKTGLKTARNVNIIPQGGTRNRPGTAYIAKAGNSANKVRLIPFIASTTQAYIIELGNFYARFYTADAQVLASGVPAWVTATAYIVGNFVTNGGTTYYCLVAHTSGTFATDLANGDWVVQTAYQIPTPYASADIFNVKFAQSADVLYMAHPSYAPQQLTFNSGASWVMAAFGFINGPFMLQNTNQALTLTPGAITNAPSAPVTITNAEVFIAGGYNGVRITTAAPHLLVNGEVFTVTGFTGAAASLNGTYTANVQSATLVYPILNGAALHSNLALGLYTAGSPVSTAYPGATLTASSPLFVAGHVGALFQLQSTIFGNTLTNNFTAVNQQSASQQCGSTYQIITQGGWTGEIAVQISTDNGTTWQIIQVLQSLTGGQNYNLTGATGVSQCLIRVVSQGTTGFNPANAPSWASNVTITLTSNSFTWTGVVQITTFVSSTVVNIAILTASGLANTAATYQWSEGSWSTYRGWPACVSFYQDRSNWASTPNSEPNTVWNSKTNSYVDFGVSSPLVASDAFSVVLASRQLNSVNFMVPMPQAKICCSGDMAFGLAPGNSGYSATSITQTPMDHRGSYNVDPVIVGNEIILLQQMGTVVRNLIFQLAVNGFMGDNVSVSSQHLFTGYSIAQMAYQQEPDSIIWAVRSDGVLLSCTYDRAQEMNAWTHHDTLGGLYESVACIPNATLGINEIWFVVNRNGTRFIEAMKPRDQGTVLSAQWFVDCGTQYNGAPATVISGIPLADGTVVAVLADGNVVSNGITDTSMVVKSGQITLPSKASIVTVGVPMVWDVGLLDIEAPQAPGKGSMQGQRVKMPRAKIRCMNSRGGYISTTPPAGNSGLTDTNGSSFDALADIMQRDPATPMDTALPLVTGIVDTPLPSGYQYNAAICLRGIDPLPFTLLDVMPTVVVGGD